MFGSKPVRECAPFARAKEGSALRRLCARHASRAPRAHSASRTSCMSSTAPNSLGGSVARDVPSKALSLFVALALAVSLAPNFAWAHAESAGQENAAPATESQETAQGVEGQSSAEEPDAASVAVVAPQASVSFDNTYLANIATDPNYRAATPGTSGFLYTGETLYALVFKSTRASVKATTRVKDDGSWSYVWYASATCSQKTLSDDDIMAGATGSSLTLADDQVGKYIFVKVVATDGTTTSGARLAGTPNKNHYGAGLVKKLEIATDLDENSFVSVQAAAESENSNDIVKGSLAAGATLYANVYDGGNKFKKRIAGKDEWTYQWLAYDSQDVSSAAYSEIVAEKTGDASLAIDEALAARLSGKYLRVKVSGNGQEIVGPTSAWNSPGPVVAAGQLMIDHVVLACNGAEFDDSVEGVPNANVGDEIAVAAYYLDNGTPTALYRGDDIDFSWQIANSAAAAEEDFTEVAAGDVFTVTQECEGKYLRVVATAKCGVPGHSVHATEPGRVLPKGVSTLYSVSILNASAVTETGGTLQAQAYKGDYYEQVPVTEGVTYTWSWTDSDPNAYGFDPATAWHAIEGVSGPSFTVPASFKGYWVSVAACAGDNKVSTEGDYYSGAAGPFAEPVEEQPEAGERLTANAKVTGVTAHAAGEEFSAEAWIPLTEFSWGSSAPKTAWDVFAKLLDKAGYYYDLSGGCPYSVTTPDGARTLAMSANAPWSYWSFIVNGEYAQTLPNSYLLKDGDSIELVYVDASGVQVEPEGEVAVNPDAEHPDVGADWAGFANGGAGAVASDAATAVANGTLDWEYSLLTSEEVALGASASASDPLIVGGKVYLVSGSTTYDTNWAAHSSLARLVVIDPATGAVERQVTLGSSMDSTCRPVYSDGIIVIPLSNGSLQAVSASTLETLWFAKGATGAQMLSTLTVKDRYVYAASADSLDETYHAASGTLKRFNLLTGAVSGVQENASAGYYWAGGVCTGGYFVVADDAGNVSAYAADLSSLTSTLSLGAPVRSTLTESDGFLYVVSADGVLYKLSVDDAGALSEVARAKVAASSTSSATIAGGYAFVGGAAADGTGVLAVVRLADMTATQVTRADGAALPAEVKGTPLVVVRNDGIRVYFTCNGAEGSWPNYTAGGGVYCYRVGDEAASKLYEPEDGRRNWCMASVVAAADGSLFYTNDSGYLFKLKPYEEAAPAPEPKPEPKPEPAPAPVPNPDNEDDRTVSPAGSSVSGTAGGEPGQAEDEAASDEVELLALTDEGVSAASGARALQGGDAELGADVGDGSDGAPALNPLAVAGIGVGVLVLLGVLAWLLLRRKREGERDEGLNA